jgi:hypothetical protein
MFTFQEKVKHLKLCLKNWNKEEFGNIFKAKKELENKMDHIQQTIVLEGRTEYLITQETNLQIHLDAREI